MGVLSTAKRCYRRSIGVNRAVSAALLGLQNARLRKGDTREPAGRIDVSLRRSQSIPPLAWICRRQGRRFDVTVGEDVEELSNGFFEGVWAGEFGMLSADQLTFGFGGILGSDRITFVVPKHAYEFLFILRDQQTGVDFVSQSLCFCLAAAGVDSSFLTELEPKLISSTDKATAAGAYRYDPFVYSDQRYSLWRFFYGNVSLSSSGRIRVTQRYLGRRFRDFAAYRQYLTRTVSLLVENGRAPERKAPFQPLATVSAGYDSSAVAVLVREAGGTDAVTLSVRVNGNDDSGCQVGEALGFDVHEVAHAIGDEIPNLDHVLLEPAHLERSSEFIATAGMGDDIAFANFEPKLHRATLFTGSFGDSIWSKESDVPPHLPCRIPYGKSLTEFRLRTGFAHVPVPVAGALLPYSIVRLSGSAEMKPFSMGGHYDRPIARRIAEEAGVPREAFGMKKAAANPQLQNARGLWVESVEKVMDRYRGSID